MELWEADLSSSKFVPVTSSLTYLIGCLKQKPSFRDFSKDVNKLSIETAVGPVYSHGHSGESREVAIIGK